MKDVHLIRTLLPFFPWDAWDGRKSPVERTKTKTKTNTSTSTSGSGKERNSKKLEDSLGTNTFSNENEDEEEKKRLPYIRELTPYDETKPTHFASDWERHQCRMFTELELCTQLARPIYLAIAGEVFDVSRGEGYYGDNGGYWYLARGDCSLGFTDLSRTESSIPDWTPAQVHGIDEWRKSYHEQYTFVGLLHGDYYDADGSPTKVTGDYLDKLKQHKENQVLLKAHRQKFPGCNSRSDSKTSEVWCGVKSGGVTRDWIGVPRRIRRPGSKDKSCACIHDFGELSEEEAMEPFIGCAEDAERCSIVRG